MKAAPWWRSAALISGTSCVLVAREAAGDEGGAELQRHADQVDRRVGVDRALLAPWSPCRRWRRTGPWSGRRRRCSRRCRSCSRRGACMCANWPRPIEARVAVAGDAEVDQLAVGQVGAGQHRRHAAMHAVEAVRRAEEVVRRLRRAADAGELGDAVRLDVELEAGLDDGGARCESWPQPAQSVVIAPS